MHKARYFVAEFAAHRHHKAPFAHGDDGVLQVFHHLGRTDHFIQVIPGPLGRRTDLPADGSEFHRRRVGNFLFI